ncbi:MAG: TIGR01906 family membrane protein [Lawsonibacter sp.]|jgi:integral membrane protein (TIGR01906 family)
MKTSKPLSVFLSLFTALAVLTGAVAVPVLCRPFYYAHIGPLKLSENTGLTVEEIRQAYDQVMDYCLGLRPDFSAGVLWYSESGASHFADVRVLFQLDLFVLCLSLLGLMVAFFYCRAKKVRPWCFRGFGPGFWAAAGLGGVFLMVGGLASLNFQRAFVLFHKLFFPGKENWMFDWQQGPVILLLPEEFFRNCALLILGVLVLWCVIEDDRDRKRPPPALRLSVGAVLFEKGLEKLCVEKEARDI